MTTAKLIHITVLEDSRLIQETFMPIATRLGTILLTALILLATFPIACSAQDADGFESIFDGKTQTGWHNPYEWGKVKIVDGEYHLIANKKFFLTTDKIYHDFEFHGEMHLPEGKSNSGFMMRGQEKKNKVFGYQAEIDPSDRKWSGGLYDESRRKWLNPLKDQPEAPRRVEANRMESVPNGLRR